MTLSEDVYTLSVTRWVYTDVRCDHCCTDLTPVDIEHHSADSLHYLGALLVTLRGGYAMFIDTWPTSKRLDPNYDKIVCRDCAEQLVAWLGGTGTH